MGFAEHKDADQSGAGGANARPNGVAGADRDCFKGLCEEEEADDHERDGCNAWPQASKALSVFEANRPRDFEKARDDEIGPCHARYGAGNEEEVECGWVSPYFFCRRNGVNLPSPSQSSQIGLVAPSTRGFQTLELG